MIRKFYDWLIGKWIREDDINFKRTERLPVYLVSDYDLTKHEEKEFIHLSYMLREGNFQTDIEYFDCQRMWRIVIQYDEFLESIMISDELLHSDIAFLVFTKRISNLKSHIMEMLDRKIEFQMGKTIGSIPHQKL